MPESAEKLVEALRASMTEVARLRKANQRLSEEAEAARAAAEPVAIVGMACRLPGGVACPDDLWRLVVEERDAVGALPDDRGWDLAALGSPAPQGGFLHGAAEFDPVFFGISPREAVAMDPQQRLVLEVSWEAVERAGIDPHALRGSRTGVYIGSAQPGYFADPRDTELQPYAVTASVTSVISGRISYTLGLEGPALTVDTACSSSLVAIHLAGRALRGGECSLALAGGVSVMPSPASFHGFGHQGILAGDGRTKAFAAAADGMTLSEGVGVMVLEKLCDARRLGHRVLALLRGSAVNQDGASNGLTAPNGPSQRRVILDALADAGLRPDEVDAVEAHGTGTELGDPIEAQALLATYGQDRPANRPLWLGSLKSNVGHAQAAAGAAGVVKAVLALGHGLLPRSLHIDAPTPSVDWSAGAVDLLTGPVRWPRTDRPRRAAVSSFGISGTNAHLILEQAPPAADAIGAAPSPASGSEHEAPVLSGPPPWTVSAKTPTALRGQAARLLAFAAADPDLDLAEAARALATARSAFEYRAAFRATDRESVLNALRALADGRTAPQLIQGTADLRGKTAFVLVDDPHWHAAATGLRATCPAFAAQLREAADALAGHLEWSPLDVLSAAPGSPEPQRPDVHAAMTVLTAAALAAVWRACGVRPSTAFGLGLGEIGARAISGALSLPDAVRAAIRADIAPDTKAGFEDAVRTAAERGHAYFIGIGHEPGRMEQVQRILDATGAEAAAIGALGLNEEFGVLLARAYARGVPVDRARAFGRPRTFVDLPTYAFDHARYWRPMGADAATSASQSQSPSPTPAPSPDPAASTASTALTTQLAAAPADRHDEILIELVRAHAAALLDFPSPDAVPARRSFQDLGLNSITAVSLKQSLESATGLTLPATIVFDHPNPIRLAARLRTLLSHVPEPESEDFDTPTGHLAIPDADDPIVIVGMSCRAPGGVESPEELWRVVADGGDTVAPPPEDRGWDLDRMAAAQESFSAVHTMREGGFLARAGHFDAGFFDICDDEALVLDPQHRILLELCWEALERSGADPLALRGERIGVYVGTFYQAYPADASQIPASSMRYVAGGASPAIAVGRVAYLFGFEGPALALDAACSSSALALHLACQAVRAGECTMALAGGVSVMAYPVSFPDLVGSAPSDGRCKSFGAGADGTGYSEGAGMVLVERLSEARRRGHRILAVVRGSAADHNGESNGLAAPNGPSQQRLIRRALAVSGLTADQVDAVEAHGAGTLLGDPVEAGALLAVYGRDRPTDRPLWLGTLKSNIGHAQAASGILGVIKTVVAMQHATLPKTLHAEPPSTLVDWSAGAVSLLTESRPWPNGDRPRRAAVSSFASNGTKVHVILEQPAQTCPAAHAPASGPIPWVLSARSPEALRAQAKRLRDYLEANPGLEPLQVGRALAGRSAFEHRATVLGDGREALLTGLGKLERGEYDPYVVTAESAAAEAGEADGAMPAMREMAGKFAAGGTVDWTALFAGVDASEVELPTYAFQRRRYWIPA